MDAGAPACQHRTNRQPGCGGSIRTLRVDLALPNEAPKSNRKESECLSRLTTSGKKLTNIFRKTKISSTQQCETQNVWHPVKKYQTHQEEGSPSPRRGNPTPKLCPAYGNTRNTRQRHPDAAELNGKAMSTERVSK